MKSVWASVSEDPVLMKRLNGWLTIMWIGMIPVSIATGWIHQVTYVSALSLWALVTGHWSTWQAARIEVAQAEEHRRQKEEPVESRVVDEIVARTDVSATTPGTTT